MGLDEWEESCGRCSGCGLGAGRPEEYILNVTFHSKLGKQGGLRGK